MNFTANHYAMLGCSVLAAVSEVVVQYVSAGNPLPFHLTAGAALAALTVLGSVSKSALADKGKPASTVASDVLRAVATSLETQSPSIMHQAILDAVKQNVLAAVPFAPPAPAAK